MPGAIRPGENAVTVGVRVRPAVAAAYRRRAAERGTTPSEVVRDVLTAAVAEDLDDERADVPA